MDWRKHYKHKRNAEYGKTSLLRGYSVDTLFTDEAENLISEVRNFNIDVDFSSQNPDRTIIGNIHEMNGTLTISPEQRNELFGMMEQIGRNDIEIRERNRPVSVETFMGVDISTISNFSVTAQGHMINDFEREYISELDSDSILEWET